MAQLRLVEVADQADSLRQIAQLMLAGTKNPEIIKAARAITRDCDPRDDLCELDAILNAVKSGDSRVAWLRKGMRYVSDPREHDTFSGVTATIESCRDGACAGDCDDSCILVGALAGAIGFKVGARGWGPGKNQDDDYAHVYCVVAVPKQGPWAKNYYGHGMDATVSESHVGWEPTGGHIMTAWEKE